jgi:hypothetical protein
MPPPLATRCRAELLLPTVKLPTSFPAESHSETKAKYETSAPRRSEEVQKLTVQDILADADASVRPVDFDETVNTFLQLFAVRFRAKAVDIDASVPIVYGVCAGAPALVHDHSKHLVVARFMGV